MPTSIRSIKAGNVLFVKQYTVELMRQVRLHFGLGLREARFLVCIVGDSLDKAGWHDINMFELVPLLDAASRGVVHCTGVSELEASLGNQAEANALMAIAMGLSHHASCGGPVWW